MKKMIEYKLAFGVVFIAFIIVFQLFSIIAQIMIFAKKFIPLFIAAFLVSDFLAQKLSKDYDKENNNNKEFYVYAFVEFVLSMFLFALIAHMFN